MDWQRRGLRPERRLGAGERWRLIHTGVHARFRLQAWSGVGGMRLYERERVLRWQLRLEAARVCGRHGIRLEHGSTARLKKGSRGVL